MKITIALFMVLIQKFLWRHYELHQLRRANPLKEIWVYDHQTMIGEC